MQSPSMPPLVDNPQHHQHQQQSYPPRSTIDQPYSTPGPAARRQPQWPNSSPDSPLTGSGSLSPLSQFNPGWHNPPSSSSPSTVVIPWGAAPPAWNGTPHPASSSRNRGAFQAQARNTDPQSWSWTKQWFSNPEGAFRWPLDSSPSPPPSTSPPDSSLALTPYQTLARHDSSATMSSTYSRSSATPSSDTGSLALSTGRPPQQWRADFKMPRTGLAAIMHRKKRSLAYPAHHNSKVVLSPYLRYNGPDTPVYWDLQWNPAAVLFRDLQRPPAQGDFTRFVCEPPVRLMRIYHTRMPWYVDAQPGNNPVGVTFADLFNAIYQTLQLQIVDADFYNDELDDEERKRITDAYRKRCGTDTTEASKGIRRVDFLMGRVVFEGLIKGKEGLWEMKTARPVLTS